MRQTAAATRGVIGVIGLLLALLHPDLAAHGDLVAAGFSIIVVTALLRLTLPRISLLKIEELLVGISAMLIVGLQDQRITVFCVLWLAALACGVMAHGGRLHWIGRLLIFGALLSPMVRMGTLSVGLAGLMAATLAMMLTSGRLTGELNDLLEKARYDADHDDLTHLLSRSAFRKRLGEIASMAQKDTPATLILIDLDGFEVVNKIAGHAGGDKLLIEVAALLESAIGENECAARLGGDEFALLVGCADGETVTRELLSALPQSGEAARVISASAGIAQAPRDGSDADALLRAADIALRVAKRTGGGGHLSTYAGSSLSGHGMQNAREELSRIIGGEGLSMAVQPIVELKSGKIHAFEALARFGATSNGSPLHWFSLADELGERDELERACMRAALQLLADRPQMVSLAVNVSAPVLLDKETLKMLAEMPSLNGLIIEVTEEALVQSDAQLTAAVAPLRERGARLAVDDMGAGYSGLRQVTTVHPSYLKLDRSLISGIESDQERIALVAALVSYSERVGSMLVAEGIETQAELQVLIDLDVPLAQGFFLGRPGEPWPEVVDDAINALAVQPDWGQAPPLRVA